MDASEELSRGSRGRSADAAGARRKRQPEGLLGSKSRKQNSLLCVVVVLCVFSLFCFVLFLNTQIHVAVDLKPPTDLKMLQVLLSDEHIDLNAQVCLCVAPLTLLMCF